MIAVGLSSNEIRESVNLIPPSDKVLQRRKEEFNINDFKIDYLSDNQKEQIAKILSDYYAAFSISLKSLGHTDKIKS